MPGNRERPLWTCPKCGVKLLTRNLWHSCGRATLAACGEYHVAPALTRIAFLGRVRFAGITSLSERGMTCSFALPRRRRSARFVQVEEVVPGWWVHRLRITEVGELDDEVQAWLRESYRWMGMQERLRERRKR